MTTIKKTNTVTKGSNIAIITEKWKNKPNYNLSNDLADYLTSQFSDPEKKFVSTTHLGQLVTVILVDPKKDANATHEGLRKNGCGICDAVNASKGKTVTVVNDTLKNSNSLALAEGIALANYQFAHHKPSAKKNLNTLDTINVVDGRLKDAQLKNLNITVDATCKARDLVNEPVNILNATGLANAFKEMGKQAGFKVEVFNKAKIVQQKMGGLLSVNAGSVDEPTFTIMEYKGRGSKNKKPYVLVGKGVVYDTGGLSLKPTPNSMDLMKCDMAGAAAVGCTMYAIAKAKLPVHVIGLVPATDNRPGFNAFAPGDIITMMDGSTVEMLNSDAEGRMILADALHFAKKYTPELTIDLATLTGAAAAAIGQYGIVAMGNAPVKHKTKLSDSGFRTHERLAEFPFWDDYYELMKSDIADMKNIGGPYGGSITAGKFLEKFTNYPYIHLDIAGPAFVTGKDSYRGKGGTGVGVRLLFDFFANK
ncbi:MAG: peptidase M17 [Bacteroidia bacterium]|nr:peptidase M17 [Bacteroidia bacterium]